MKKESKKYILILSKGVRREQIYGERERVYVCERDREIEKWRERIRDRKKVSVATDNLHISSLLKT